MTMPAMAPGSSLAEEGGGEAPATAADRAPPPPPPPRAAPPSSAAYARVNPNQASNLERHAPLSLPSHATAEVASLDRRGAAAFLSDAAGAAASAAAARPPASVAAHAGRVSRAWTRTRPALQLR